MLVFRDPGCESDRVTAASPQTLEGIHQTKHYRFRARRPRNDSTQNVRVNPALQRRARNVEHLSGGARAGKQSQPKREVRWAAAARPEALGAHATWSSHLTTSREHSSQTCGSDLMFSRWVSRSCSSDLSLHLIPIWDGNVLAPTASWERSEFYCQELLSVLNLDI